MLARSPPRRLPWEPLGSARLVWNLRRLIAENASARERGGGEGMVEWTKGGPAISASTCFVRAMPVGAFRRRLFRKSRRLFFATVRSPHLGAGTPPPGFHRGSLFPRRHPPAGTRLKVFALTGSASTPRGTGGRGQDVGGCHSRAAPLNSAARRPRRPRRPRRRQPRVLRRGPGQAAQRPP